MSEPKYVEVFARPEDMQDTAIQLLAAAGDTPEVVATVSGGFRVPAEVAAAAGISTADDGAVDAAKVESDTATSVAYPRLAHGIEDPEPAQLVDANPSVTLPAAQELTERLTGSPTEQAEGGQEQALRGKDLDDALDAAQLSKSGTVAEKQARLAEYRANA